MLSYDAAGIDLAATEIWVAVAPDRRRPHADNDHLTLRMKREWTDLEFADWTPSAFGGGAVGQ